MLEFFLNCCKWLYGNAVVTQTVVVYCVQVFIKWIISYVSKRKDENFLELLAQSGQDVTLMGFSFFLISILTKTSSFHVSVRTATKAVDPVWVSFVVAIGIMLYFTLSILAIVLNRKRRDSLESDRIFSGSLPKKFFYEIIGYFVGFLALVFSLASL